jgi:hypothetical protein
MIEIHLGLGLALVLVALFGALAGSVVTGAFLSRGARPRSMCSNCKHAERQLYSELCRECQATEARLNERENRTRYDSPL